MPAKKPPSPQAAALQEKKKLAERAEKIAQAVRRTVRNEGTRLGDLAPWDDFFALAADLKTAGMLDKDLFGSETALAFAAHHGKTREVQAVLDLGADPQAPTTYGQSPLMQCLAVETGGEVEVERALANMALLLDAGADVHHRNQVGQQALHWAAMHGEASIARLLMGHGADPSAPDTDKQTPLHYSAKIGQLDACKALVEGGADLRAQGKERDKKVTPLELCLAWSGYVGEKGLATLSYLLGVEIALRERAALDKAAKPPKAKKASSPSNPRI